MTTTVEDRVYSALSQSVALTAIVSARIYPEITEQEVDPPCVAYARTVSDFTHTIHSGMPVCADVTVEVWCMSHDRVEADSMADAVVAALVAADFKFSDRRIVLRDVQDGLVATVVTFVYFDVF